MDVRVAALAAVALLSLACASAPTPSPAPSSPLPSGPSPSVGQSIEWPPFEPLGIQEAVANAMGMGCTVAEQRIRCALTRPSGARFESQGPDGTDPNDRELDFIASGPIELESEARRLFSAVAGGVSADAELSAWWQDQIWANLNQGSVQAAVLPNGVTWSASRQSTGDVLVWSLNLTW